MSSPLLECVVNISEGRDRSLLLAMAKLLQNQATVRLLHLDAGYDAHRTVFTFAGPPKAVINAAFELISFCALHIDMRQQTGSHSRIGAVDVCPLVPISGINLAETAELARQLGQRVGQELALPVYLYEASATSPHRQNLAAIRKGQYEGLADKMQHPDWMPDFGPKIPVPKFGAVVIGARDFLVAYNINLSKTAPLSLAKRLAGQLRTSGQKGQPGIFPGLKAIGWYQESFGCCQVSMNVVQPDIVNIAEVYERCQQLAQTAGYDTAGSELIGLIPEKHLLAAGRYWQAGASVAQAREVAIAGLGLSSLSPFIWEERVLESTLIHSAVDAQKWLP